VEETTRKRLIETLKQFHDASSIADFETAFRLLSLNLGGSDAELAEAFEKALLGISVRREKRE
jgi:hypothetical protein